MDDPVVNEYNRDVMSDRVAALEAENKRLKRALNWYGDKANWWVPNNNTIGHHNMGDGSMERYEAKPGTVDSRGHFFPDCGSTARVALKGERQ